MRERWLLFESVWFSPIYYHILNSINHLLDENMNLFTPKPKNPSKQVILMLCKVLSNVYRYE